MYTGVLLHHIAEKENTWVRAHSTLRQLFQLMHKNKKGVVVVLKGRKPVGILTERDLIRLLYSVWANEKALSRFGRKIIDKPVTELVSSKRWNDIYSTLIERNKIEDVRFKKDNFIYEVSGFYLPLEELGLL
ncbi:MAG TPA: CBS domain-containing protein [Syntrophaceae bacterium]|nr:CBS domain-containing protein [Syntrophaceae bacterium]